MNTIHFAPASDLKFLILITFIVNIHSLSPSSCLAVGPSTQSYPALSKNVMPALRKSEKPTGLESHRANDWLDNQIVSNIILSLSHELQRQHTFNEVYVLLLRVKMRIYPT